MDLNLAVSNVRNRNCSHAQPERNLIEGFSPPVELKETRSSYFLNLNLQGLTKDDIRLGMDHSRKLIIRGQKRLQDIGMVGWTWRLVERDGPSSRRRKPFRIPEDVNAGALSATFRQGVLHLVMPKLRRSRFSPYRIRIHSSSEDDRRRRHPPTSMQKGDDHQTDQMIPQGGGGKEFGEEKMQDVHMEMEVKDPEKCESPRYLRRRKSKPAREYVLLLDIQARCEMRMKRKGEQRPKRRTIKVKG